MAASGRLPLGEGAEDETKNSKFAKRTWNVSWNQEFHFWRLTSPSQIGRGGMAAAPGREACGGGGIAADVDSKGVKRTSRAIVLKINEILAFRANELYGVKSFAM